MSTSDIKTVQKSAAKTAFVYLLIALFCALFGAIYEHFSHEVYSYYMIYAFALPLAGGTLPFLAISIFCSKHYPRPIARNLYHSGIATLTVGSILRGILDIYGTTNRLNAIYLYVGITLTVLGIFVYFINTFLSHNRPTYYYPEGQNEAQD